MPAWVRRLTVACSVTMLVSAALLGARAGAGSAPSAGTPCDKLTALTIPNVTIASSSSVAPGPFSPAGTPPPAGAPAGAAGRAGRGGGLTVPAMCRVALVAAPSADSHINIEVWLPVAAAWNGRFLGTDNGGFSGAIGYAAMASAAGRGYAVAGTDTGHTGDQMEFGQGHPERVIDWSYRAIHLTAEIGQLIARDYYGRFADKTYFSGCSTGGQQALSEAQRFPADYDGIVAGDPGYNRTRLIFGFLWGWLATHTDDGSPILPQAKLALLTKSAIEACDAADGLKDGIIGDPRKCKFDPAVLQCKAGDSDTCLTAPQVQAVQKVYAGARNPRTGEQLYPGWARGTEQGWPQYLTAPREAVRIGLFRDFVFDDPNWDPHTFDWDRDAAYVEAQVPDLSATSTDLGAFKARGGKLVMYTGLADPVVPPQDPIDYYEAVAKASGGYAATQQFFRFFPVPGMGHCSGGAGPSTFDALGALEQWVEHGTAPARLIASHASNGQVDRTRPLCPYPQVARYKGTGSTDDAASFACATLTGK